VAAVQLATNCGQFPEVSFMATWGEQTKRVVSASRQTLLYWDAVFSAGIIK
jgi:hypothetical protein